MFDDFHNSCGIVAGEACIPIGQRTMKQANSLFLCRGQVVRMEFLRRDLEDAV